MAAGSVRIANRRGFTLIELLVVVAILAVLIGLMLPAIQSVRESARQVECRNHLKQLALGLSAHHELHRRFPSNGWSPGWVGDADRGSGREQPGGWLYSVLPYIGQQSLHRMGRGERDPARKELLHGNRHQVPVGIFYCPSRRRPRLYPCYRSYHNAAHADRVVKNDYAANGGDAWIPWGNMPPFKPPPHELTDVDQPIFQWPDTSHQTGVFFATSRTSLSHITDGASNTYLIGEKYVFPNDYDVGRSFGNDETAYCGQAVDITRWTHPEMRPARDTTEADFWTSFGGAHPAGFLMAFCDGSVRSIDYNIDPETHRVLGNRRDGSIANPAAPE